MDGARRQNDLRLPNNSVEDSPPIPPSQVSTSCEEGKKYNVKRTLQVIDDDVDALLPLEIQHSNPELAGESKKCEGLFFGGRNGTKLSDHTTFTNKEQRRSCVFKHSKSIEFF
mmetsp:Transcript_9463/g.18847  ORF Transcript_9463/g.18847 Transcript_9463/m.18847 type:complete len:113 (-) Transcript_9463:28-366(-)